MANAEYLTDGGDSGMEATILVSGISAVLQAIQTWIAYKDSNRAAEAFEIELKKAPQDQALINEAKYINTLAPPDVISTLTGRANKCWTKYHHIIKAPDGTYMDSEIDDATEAVKRCICRELKRIKSLNGTLPPGGKLNEWWNQYGCI